ncbi:MAG TPA: penicillin-binding transpeptidase domain-containing protein [Acidimicrobiales bacterium]|nr:penicillin-binding transpeptidase domain-containing protein [Acidimicrobiales bacterium]HUB69215.1 penicillin-binding transpeptidase domain-containing protein [Acidimicrobiales bacterium]
MNKVNQRVRWAGAGTCLLLAALFVQLSYLQVFHAGALNSNPLNTRDVLAQFTAPRGAIISADGVTLAESVPSNDQYKYQREYPQGALFGSITGYFSFIYGTDGLEDEYSSVLSEANTPVTLPKDLQQIKEFFTNQPAPDDLHITALSWLQQLAATELAGRAGAVVALAPSTGAVLAMYSNPSYNPNPLASHNPAVEEAAWKSLNADRGSPLVAAAYRQRFFPGSTFKMITSAAVFDHDPALANRAIPVLTGLVLPDTAGQVLHNFGGEACGGKLTELFTVSCDTGFARLGLDLGGDKLAEEARAFGWDKVPPLDLPGVAESYFPPASSFFQNAGALAKSAIGQESVQAVPLTLALDAAGIANGGKIMTPHLMADVTGSQGQTVTSYKPSVWLTATSPATAKHLTNLMLSVVNSPNGTGVEARIPGIQVAGKTGTAQTGGPYIETWFVAFAPVPNPKIAVAVLVEDQPPADEYQGGTIAAPIAKAIIQAYLEKGET